jgi:hypothetical protein
MVEVVKVPVVGKVPKPALYAGGAAVAGIVGYAWWTRGALIEDETTDVELPATDFEPPTVVDSGISVGGAAAAEPIARTNVEWRSMAAEQAAALGFADAVINSGLTKYLAKERLGATELLMVSAVVAILGQPPTGGPYPIIAAPVAPTPTATKPAAPSAVNVRRINRTQVIVSWTPVVGATRYEVRTERAPAQYGPWNSTGLRTSSVPITLHFRTRYAWSVRAVNAAGTGPARRSATITQTIGR